MPVLKGHEMLSMETVTGMIERDSFGVPAIKSVEFSPLWDGIMVNDMPFLSRKEIENCLDRYELQRLIKRKIEQLKERHGVSR